MQNIDTESAITFHEKMAWVMSASLLVGAAFYFRTMLNLSAAADPVPKPAVLVLTVIFVVILAAAAIIGSILAAVTNVADAGEPADERDHLIALRSGRWGNAVTGIFLILTMGSYFFEARSSDMLLGIMAAMIAGHLVDYISQIYLYRRQA